MKYNIILFSDVADANNRNFGVYRMATELRMHGYTTLVVDFLSFMDASTFQKIVEKHVTVETICVGFSTTWFMGKVAKTMFKVEDIQDVRKGFISFSESFDREEIHKTTEKKMLLPAVSHEIDFYGFKKYADIIRQANPRVKVVVGGAKAFEHITDASVDHVLIGYAENHFVEYLDSLTGKSKRRLFNKLINHDVKAIQGQFNFKDVRTEYTDTDLITQDEILYIEFSRGCIFNCGFCSYPFRGQKTKDFMRSKTSIQQELMENWTRWGVTRYRIVDDTFNDYTEKLRYIKAAIEELPFKPVFKTAYVRMELVDAEQAQLIKDLNIREVFWGNDTWSEKTGKIIKKGTSRQKKIESLKVARSIWKNSVRIMASHVIGLPEDTVESWEEFIHWYDVEGYTLIDILAFQDLVITPDLKQEGQPWLSDIDINYTSYNYSFPDADNPFSWVRSTGDINSRSQAQVLAEQYTNRIRLSRTPQKDYDKYHENLELKKAFFKRYFDNLVH